MISHVKRKFSKGNGPVVGERGGGSTGCRRDQQTPFPLRTYQPRPPRPVGGSSPAASPPANTPASPRAARKCKGSRKPPSTSYGEAAWDKTRGQHDDGFL